MDKVKFISEISSNHNNDMVRIKETIDASSSIGCDGIKFQFFKIEELFSKEILSKSKMHRDRKLWELKEEFIPEIAQYCKKLGIKFGCTPFYIDGVNILSKHVEFFKIASYELLWKKLFIECGKIGKPVHFSTGMANENEVLDSLNALLSTNTSEVTVYQCNSAYPTPVQDANLNKIKTLKRIVKKSNNLNDIRINIGYSDHTVSPSVIYRAIHKFNVKYVEFHIDLDGQGAEYKAGHCWLPDDIGNVISTSKLAFKADGLSNFHPSNSELPDRDWRADPNDGLRPFKKIRKSFNG